MTTTERIEYLVYDDWRLSISKAPNGNTLVSATSCRISGCHIASGKRIDQAIEKLWEKITGNEIGEPRSKAQRDEEYFRRLTA